VSEAAETASGRRANKRAAVFRTIGEVAENLDLPAHVLRFWESKFPQLKPLKRGGGRRYYGRRTSRCVGVSGNASTRKGYTIRGVQKLLAEGALSMSGAPAETAAEPFPARAGADHRGASAGTRRAQNARGSCRNRTVAGVQKVSPTRARPASKPPCGRLLTGTPNARALLHRNRKN